jgi:hypothetical protein
MNPFKVEYPTQVVTWKGKLAYQWQWHMYLMDLGRGQVIGKVTQIFPEVSLMLLVLDKLGYVQLTVTQILAITAIGMVAIWVLGYLVVLTKLDSMLALVQTNRNPILCEIHKATNGKRGNGRKG